MSISTKKIQKALDEALLILSRNMIKFLNRRPMDMTDVHGFYDYDDTETVGWGFGMQAGLYWLSYEMTGRVDFNYYAQRKTDELIATLKKPSLSYTDMGFLTLPSCSASYKLTKNEKAKAGAIYAADSLLRHCVKGANIVVDKYNPDSEDSSGSAKISNLVNMLLLNWAYKISSMSKYKSVADENIELILKSNIQRNGEVYFRSNFDLLTGESKGFSDFPKTMEQIFLTTKARAEAWAVYGLASNYAISKSPHVLKYYKTVTDCLLSHMSNGELYYYYPSGAPSKIPDVLAMAIGVCGILEMRRQSNETFIDEHFDAAEGILELLIDKYSVPADSFRDGLVRNSPLIVPSLHIGTLEEYENVSTVQGDYFYLEALVRSLKNWNSYWY